MNTYKSIVPWIILFLIAIFGFYLRFEYVKTVKIISPIRADAREYYSIANNIVNKGVYSQEYSEKPKPDAIRTPGYPLFLAGLLFISSSLDSFYENVLLAQVILDTISIILVFCLLRYFLPFYFSLLGSFLYVLSPHSIVMTGYFLTETLFTFLLLSSIYLLFIGMRKDNYIFYFLSSSLMGAAILVRPTLLLFPSFILPVLFCFYKKNFKKTLLIFMILLLGVIMIHTPWWIRNYKVLGKMGDNRVAVRTFAQGIDPEFIIARDNPELTKISSSFSNVMHAIVLKAKKEPLKHIKWFTYQKIRIFWQWDIVQGVNDIFVYPVIWSTFHGNTLYKSIKIFMRILHPIFLLLALLSPFLIGWGFYKKTFRISSAWPVVVFITAAIYFTILHIIIVPLPRYSIPLRPVLYGLALFSIYNLCILLHVRRS